MAITLLRNVRGKQGVPGKQGDQGLPGVNAVANDTATAAQIANATPTATQAALDARSARRKAAPFEVNETFNQYANGALTKTQTGIPIITYGATAAAVPRIEAGTLTFDTTAIAGGYSSVQLAAPATRAGASFFFDAGSAAGGVACIAIMEKEIGASIGAGTGVPKSPMHLQITPTTWSLDVFITESSTPTTIAQGAFSTALATDGATIHSTEIVLDRINGKAYLTLPDGNVIEAASPHFKAPGTFVFWEPFRNTVTQSRARFTEAWASSQSGAELPSARRMARLQKGSTWFAESSVGADMTVSGTLTDVPGCAVTYSTPADGKVLVTLSAQIDSTAVGDVYFAIKYLGGGLLALRAVRGTGYHSVTIPLTLTAGPGYMREISFGVQQAGGTNTLRRTANFTASIKVEHYQA